jgi:hypothetical protein
VKGWGRFAAWVALGALLGLATLSLNIAFALVIVGLAIFAWRREPAAFGVLTGAGLLALWVAWRNLGGPGLVCTPTSCDQLMSPMPWLAAGIALVAAGLVLQRVALRRRSSVTSPAR